MQSFHFLLVLGGFRAPEPSYLLVEQVFVVLYSCFEQFKVLVGVLLKFADPHSQVVVLLEDHRLHKLLLLLEPHLQVVIEVIYLTVDLVLEFIEVLLNRSESALHVFPVLLCVLQVVPQLLGQFCEDALHLTVLLSHHFDHLLDLGIDVMAQLPRTFCRLSSSFPDSVGKFLV